MFQKVFLRINRAKRFRSGMIALCAIGAIVLVALGPSPLLANPGTVTVRVDPLAQAVPVNGMFTVDIVADNVDTEMNPDGLGAYEFDVTYNKDYLEVVTDGVTDAGDLGATGRTVNELGPNIDNPSGRTTFAAYSHPPADTNGPVNPTVALATVTLLAKQAGVMPLNLENALLTDTQANAWPDGGTKALQVISGTVILKTVPGNFDDDCKADMVIYNVTDGRWAGLTSGSGYSTTSGKFYRTYGGAGWTPVPADFDGDGQSDVGIYNVTDARWTILTSGSGYSYSTGKIYRRWGGTGWTPVPADFDGDGQADVVVYNDTGGYWSGLTSSSGYSYTTGKLYRLLGGTGWTPVPADFDGDGQADMVVYNDADGRWVGLTSSSGYSYTTGKIYKKWGGTGWTPLPADFDGDGRADMIIYNVTNGQWTGLLSSNDYSTAPGSTFSMTYGGTGWSPVPSNFDCDYAADVGIYNDSNGNWAIRTSSSGYSAGIYRQYGGSGWIPLPDSW